MKPSFSVPHLRNEETPPYPRGTEPQTTAREIKTLIAAIIPNRLRFKISQDPSDTDLERHKTDISVGDHTALVTYLLDYFSTQEGVGTDSNFLNAFDIALAHDLGDTTNGTGLVGIKKDIGTEEKELEKVASLLNSFPEHFRAPFIEAYRAYLARESTEAQLVRGLNGLATMLYVLWKPKETRRAFVGGNGYTQRDYEERIGKYCTHTLRNLKRCTNFWNDFLCGKNILQQKLRRRALPLLRHKKK